MKNDTRIYLNEFQLAFFTTEEAAEFDLTAQHSADDYYMSFFYDQSHDFFADEDFGGVVAWLNLKCWLGERRLSRTVRVSLFDVTAHHEVAAQTFRVDIGRYDDFDLYAAFRLDGYSRRDIHTFMVVATDLTVHHTFCREAFCIYESEVYGGADDIFLINSAGIRPADKPDTYRALTTVDGRSYFIRFDLIQNFKSHVPPVLPALELILIDSAGRFVQDEYIVPQCIDAEKGDYRVEMEFTTPCLSEAGTESEFPHVYYAALYSEYWPIAGFVFDTKAQEIFGAWCDHQVKPLREITSEAIRRRHMKSSTASSTNS